MKFHDFTEKGHFSFRMLRNRSLGDFCKIYESEKQRKRKDQGCTFTDLNFALKEISRNDLKRLVRVQFFRHKKKKEPEFMGEADFTVYDLVENNKLEFNIYKGKGIFGKLEFENVK